MNDSGLSLFETGVWVIPLVLLATIAGLFLLVLYWKNKTQQDLKGVRAVLRHSASQRALLRQSLHTYSAEDAEPFGSRLAALTGQLEALDEQARAIELHHVELQERIRRLSLQRWRLTVGAPYLWYLVRQDVKALQGKLTSLETGLAAAAESGERLAHIPWEVAQQVRQTSELEGQVRERVTRLQAKHVRGDAMDAAVKQHGGIRQALEEVAEHFFKGDQETVLQQAEKDATAYAHQVAQDSRPALEALLSQLQGWEKQYGEAASQVGRLKTSLGSVEQLLDTMPPELDLAATRARFNQLKVIAQNLGDTLNRMEVESMEAVTAEAQRVLAASQELETQLKGMRQKLSELENALPELSASLKLLSAQIAALGTSPVHPLIWDQSRGKLTQLSRQTGALGSGKKARTPEQVEEDLAAVRQLDEQAKELARLVTEVEKTHTELAGLAEKPEISQGLEWARATRRLAERVAVYDPENWARADNVSTLAEDLKALEEHLRSYDASEPLAEGALGQRLETMRRLATFAGSLRSRAANIQNRLEEIQRAEKDCQEQVEAARQALTQIAHLARSNPLLEEKAAPEIKRLQGSLNAAAAELEQRQRGAVDKKVRSLGALTEKVYQAGSQWHDLLTREIEAQKKTLGQKITGLEAIATLGDPAIAEARRILAEGQSIRPGPAEAKGRAGLQDTLLELRRRSEYWQTCSAAIRALEDMEQPLLDTYKDAAEMRDYAREVLETSLTWLGGAGAWPPTQITLLSEKQELSRVEEQWQALKQQQTRAIELVAQLGNLTGKYQAVAEKIRTAVERAVEERRRIGEVETELDELAQSWHELWQTYANNATASDQIRKLLNDAESERNSLKQQFRRGARNYAQVLQALQNQHRRLRMAQVPVDEEHVVGLNGQAVRFQ